MARGRPPKPDALNELRGDPGKRRRYEIAPKGPEGSPVPPAYLSEAARAIWDEVLPDLEAMGVVTKIDRLTLVVLVEAYARYRAAAEKIDDEGPLTEDGKYSPLNRVIVDNIATVNRILIEFGCTPAARARMRMKVDKKKPKSKWDGKLKIAGRA